MIGWLEILDIYNLLDKGNLCHFILILASPQNIEALFDNELIINAKLYCCTNTSQVNYFFNAMRLFLLRKNTVILQFKTTKNLLVPNSQNWF